MLDRLSFEIMESPVVYYDQRGFTLQDSTHKVLYRSDDDNPLSVMKAKYQPMYNEHFMETTQRMSEISGFGIAGYSEINHGVIVISHLKNNLENLNIGGCDIEDYLVLGSSCDGRYSFFVGTTTELLRCQNQFSRMNQMQKVRHSASAPIKIENLLRSLEIYFNERKQMYDNFERMGNYKVDIEIKKDAIAYILKLEKEEMIEGNLSPQKMRQIDQLSLAMNSEISGLGRNLWGMFNGVTYYTTHVMTHKEQMFGNLFGKPADINRRMYEYSTMLLT